MTTTQAPPVATPPRLASRRARLRVASGIGALALAATTFGLVAAPGVAVAPGKVSAGAYPRPAPAPAPAASPVEVEPPPAPPAPATPAEQAFADLFPAQWDAVRGDGPGGDHWAVLIGINVHLGAVPDNYVSRYDAELLTHLLRRGGYRADHVVLLTDTDATGTMIREALSWLAARTGPESTVVVHYSGHSKKWYGQDHDGDGEITDEGWWPTDDDFLVDSEIVTRINQIPAARMWINIAACNAEGFNDPGLDAPGRLLTFSSGEEEKSYEDPENGYSVWGDHLLRHAIFGRLGDTDGDRMISVQEAFPIAAERAALRTSTQQPYGPQNAVMIDRVGEPFHLSVWR
jgi:hypothetical protein